MLSLADAVERALAVHSPLGTERVAVAEARTRRLASGIVATKAVPPFDASAMDGYAVRAEDLAHATADHPVVLHVIGEVRAGIAPERTLERGEAMRIFTGAPMPPGADSVIIQEDTTRLDADVSCRYAPRCGLHVRARGGDLAIGAQVVEAYARLEAGEIAVLVSQEFTFVEVVRRPTVAILCTGDELRELGEPDRAGSIVGSNGPMLAALVAREGGLPRLMRPVRDEPAAIAAALREALDADVVLTTGGVSVGDHDHVPAVLAELGIETVFAKVRMKPGKPVVVARHGTTPVVGLPGNPASALVGFELFVAPGLRRMQGDPTPFAAGVVASLEAEHRRSPGRPELARGRLLHDPEAAAPRLRLTSTQGSSALRSLVGVDCLALFGAESERIEAGAPVFVLPLGAPGVLATSPLRGRAELRDAPRV